MSAAERDPQAPEIRAWGAENGWDVKPGGRIPAALRSAWATANAGGAGPLREAAANGHRPARAPSAAGGPVTFTIPDYVPPDLGAGLEPPPPDGWDAEPADELPPAEPPRQSRRERITGRFTRRQAGPARPRRRVTLETLGGLLWAGGAQLAARRGQRFMPVATLMAFQSPVAGLVLEDALKNTLADHLLQPVARVVESGSVIGSLVGPPALAGLVCVRPELYPVARPLLEASMKEWVITAGPKLRELRRREERFQAEMAELNGEEGESGLDIGEILDLAFAPLFAQAQPEAEAAGAAAQ